MGAAAVWQQAAADPVFALCAALTLGVLFVNGWTDAPNAIATVVTGRVMPVGRALAMAAVCNVLGAAAAAAANAAVIRTVNTIVDFGTDSRPALTALSAALCAVVVWAVAAWWFGIPTSESHALLAGLTGAALALQGGLSAVNGGAWAKVLWGLALSVAVGFGLGWAVCRLLRALCRGRDRLALSRVFRAAQIGGGAAMAFCHGAQDGQKFMGILLLGMALSMGEGGAAALAPPLWLVLLCAGVMGLGTAVGGRRIIRAVGMDMVRLEGYQGFSADAAGAVSLLLSTAWGLPVSTTHAKTAAMLGAGAAVRPHAVDWRVARDMALTWAFTFPGCGAVGYAMARLFLCRAGA